MLVIRRGEDGFLRLRDEDRLIPRKLVESCWQQPLFLGVLDMYQSFWNSRNFRLLCKTDDSHVIRRSGTEWANAVRDEFFILKLRSYFCHHEFPSRTSFEPTPPNKLFVDIHSASLNMQSCSEMPCLDRRMSRQGSSTLFVRTSGSPESQYIPICRQLKQQKRPSNTLRSH